MKRFLKGLLLLLLCVLLVAVLFFNKTGKLNSEHIDDSTFSEEEDGQVGASQQQFFQVTTIDGKMLGCVCIPANQDAIEMEIEVFYEDLALGKGIYIGICDSDKFDCKDVSTRTFISSDPLEEPITGTLYSSVLGRDVGYKITLKVRKLILQVRSKDKKPLSTVVVNDSAKKQLIVDIEVPISKEDLEKGLDISILDSNLNIKPYTTNEIVMAGSIAPKTVLVQEPKKDVFCRISFKPASGSCFVDGQILESQFESYSYDIEAVDVYNLAMSYLSAGNYYAGGRLLEHIGYDIFKIENLEYLSNVYMSFLGVDKWEMLTLDERDTFMNAVSAKTVFGFEPQIGWRGPAGGRVFYDKGTYSDGWRYLEAAPSDLSGGRYVWGEYGWIKTSTEIGTGYANTMKISSYRDGDVTAAKACLDYSVNGYDDWFLPSKDELDLMYKNLDVRGVGSFANDGYWSSSENNSDGAWLQYFFDGSQNYNSRYLEGRVRPVRAF